MRRGGSSESLVQLADRVIPFRTAARWAGIDAGGRNKTWCPWGAFEHDDGGREQAFRVYDDHGYCFAEQKYFTVTTLLAVAWEVSREDAAVRALRDFGWRPAGYAHLWADASKPPEPDRDALREALALWCSGQCSDWADRQYEPRTAARLARCYGLLPLVRTPDDCEKWLARCKQAMSPLVLSQYGNVSLGAAVNRPYATYALEGVVMPKPARTLMELEELPGWLTFGEAAALMNISVERVRQLASQPNPKLTTARRIGQRPLGIIREAEVQQWIREKQAQQARREAAAEDAAELQPLPDEIRTAHLRE